MSLGLAASSSLPFLTGCHRGWGAGHPATFNPGIRIFFIGAWIFCADPLGGGMLAVAVDMPCLKHTFPYGVWPGPEGINQNESLQEIPTCNSHDDRNAYPLTLPGFQPPYSSVSEFFASACPASFNYFENAKGDMHIDFTHRGIRVISFPLATSMITADITPGCVINNNDDTHQFHKYPSGAARCKYSYQVPTVRTPSNSNCSYEIATAHIFEYDGAHALTFKDKAMIEQDSKGHRADFHFHTVPPAYAPPGHTSEMFFNLISTIPALKGADFSLSGMKYRPVAGPCVPDCVDASELTLPPGAVAEPPPGYHFPQHGSLASCAAPGFGYNG